MKANETINSNVAIGTEIRNQIGHKALFMLGAKNIFATDNGLVFKIGGSKRFSHIEVELTVMDTYKVTFKKIVGYNLKNTEVVQNIYADMLNETISSKTELYTSL